MNVGLRKTQFCLIIRENKYMALGWRKLNLSMVMKQIHET